MSVHVNSMYIYINLLILHKSNNNNICVFFYMKSAFNICWKALMRIQVSNCERQSCHGKESSLWKLQDCEVYIQKILYYITYLWCTSRPDSKYYYIYPVADLIIISINDSIIGQLTVLLVSHSHICKCAHLHYTSLFRLEDSLQFSSLGGHKVYWSDEYF